MPSPLPGRPGGAYTRIAMPKSSLEELRGQISAGDYVVDSGKVAGEMLSTFTLIRRVRRLLIGDSETAMSARIARARGRRRARAQQPRAPRSRRERLQ